MKIKSFSKKSLEQTVECLSDVFLNKHVLIGAGIGFCFGGLSGALRHYDIIFSAPEGAEYTAYFHNFLNYSKYCLIDTALGAGMGFGLAGLLKEAFCRD